MSGKFTLETVPIIIGLSVNNDFILNKMITTKKCLYNVRDKRLYKDTLKEM